MPTGKVGACEINLSKIDKKQIIKNKFLLKKLLMCYHNRDIRFCYFKPIVSVRLKSEKS